MEIVIFDVSIGYEELVNILHIEGMEQSDDSPCDKTDVTGEADDDDDLLTYLTLTNIPRMT